LPLYTRMTDSDQRRVIQAVRSLLSRDKRKVWSADPADVIQACH
jgi:hypothetical protein